MISMVFNAISLFSLIEYQCYDDGVIAIMMTMYCATQQQRAILLVETYDFPAEDPLKINDNFIIFSPAILFQHNSLFFQTIVIVLVGLLLRICLILPKRFSIRVSPPSQWRKNLKISLFVKGHFTYLLRWWIIPI